MSVNGIDSMHDQGCQCCLRSLCRAGQPNHIIWLNMHLSWSIMMHVFGQEAAAIVLSLLLPIIAAGRAAKQGHSVLPDHSTCCSRIGSTLLDITADNLSHACI